MGPDANWPGPVYDVSRRTLRPRIAVDTAGHGAKKRRVEEHEEFEEENLGFALEVSAGAPISRASAGPNVRGERLPPRSVPRGHNLRGAPRTSTPLLRRVPRGHHLGRFPTQR